MIPVSYDTGINTRMYVKITSMTKKEADAGRDSVGCRSVPRAFVQATIGLWSDAVGSA